MDLGGIAVANSSNQPHSGDALHSAIHVSGLPVDGQRFRSDSTTKNWHWAVRDRPFLYVDRLDCMAS